MFGCPTTGVLSSVPAITFSWVLFIWLHKLRITVLLINFSYVLGVECRTPVSVWDGTFWENIWQYYLLFIITRVTCYVLSGFRNSPLISIHIIIQLSLLLYFSKYIPLSQYYEFPFILKDSRHIYQRILRQLRAESKTRAMIGRCKFIEFVEGRKFL